MAKYGSAGAVGEVTKELVKKFLLSHHSLDFDPSPSQTRIIKGLSRFPRSLCRIHNPVGKTARPLGKLLLGTVCVQEWALHDNL
jgi:hypothetical protein